MNGKRWSLEPKVIGTAPQEKIQFHNTETETCVNSIYGLKMGSASFVTFCSKF